jgi:hypothetical protein
MLSKKSFGIAGAAMLGTVALLGTNAAYAVIDLDADDQSDPAATYAMETITAAVEGADGAMYYTLDGGDNALDVQGEVGVGGTSGSVLILEYVFDGMVFTSMSDPMLSIGSNNCTGGTDATKRAGGDKGENKVSFIFTRTNDTLDDDTEACLMLENMAVSMDGGGVTLNVSDNLPLPATHSEGYSGAVAIASALEEMATASNPKATVASSFLSFEGNVMDADTTNDTTQQATVGSFMTSVDTDLLAADDGNAVEELDLYAVGATTANAEAGDGESSVTISGDFSFVTMAFLHDAADCDSNNPTDLRMDIDADTEMRDTTRLKAQTLGYVNANTNLCITVEAADSEDAVAIPETAPYMVTVSYGGGTADAKYPTRGMARELGMIVRDGTTVRFPYLTTYAGYNQRIIVVNRGGAATYSMSFMPEKGEATEGEDANGELEANSTTVFSLKNDDVVTLSEGSRTAGTLIVEAQRNMIDVATTIVNTNTGSTDTITY